MFEIETKETLSDLGTHYKQPAVKQIREETIQKYS